jgi:hypothetical protein
MMDLIAAPENLIFATSIGLMLAITMIEAVGFLVVGSGLLSFIDSMIPGVELELNIDGPEKQIPTLSKFFSWLRVGKIPFIMLLVIMLTSFGLVGFVGQSLCRSMIGILLPGWLMAIPAFLVSLFLVHWLGALVARIIPKGETEAVSRKTFIGKVATITIGTAQVGSPAEAKLKDSFGYTHYIMVEPDLIGEAFEQGTRVLLVFDDGHCFKAILNPNEALS